MGCSRWREGDPVILGLDAGPTQVIRSIRSKLSYGPDSNTQARADLYHRAW
jgi:hypothetical protein